MITRFKMEGESRLYSFDFAEVEEVVEGDDLAGTPSITADPDDSDTTLEIGAAAITGTEVKALISGGVVGESYTLTCLVETVSGKRLGAKAVLVII